jgi:hypothetical protein
VDGAPVSGDTVEERLEDAKDRRLAELEADLLVVSEMYDKVHVERDRLRAALTRTGDGWHCCLPGSVVVTPDDKCVVLTADEAEQIKGAIRNLLVPWMEEAAGPLDAISADCANAEKALALLGEEKPDATTIGERGEVSGATWDEATE